MITKRDIDIAKLQSSNFARKIKEQYLERVHGQQMRQQQLPQQKLPQQPQPPQQ